MNTIFQGKATEDFIEGHTIGFNKGYQEGKIEIRSKTLDDVREWLGSQCKVFLRRHGASYPLERVIEDFNKEFVSDGAERDLIGVKSEGSSNVGKSSTAISSETKKEFGK